MGRPVVHDQVNVQARVGALVQEMQEAGEGGRVVAADRLGDDLPGGDVQRGNDGDGTVADVFEFPSCQPARPGGPLGISAVLGQDPSLLTDADHHGARRRAQVHLAHRGGLCPELLVVPAVQPALDPVWRQLQAACPAGQAT
jgi:hypothetical protein